MLSNEFAVNAVNETCAALSAGNVSEAENIIRTKYPHDPNARLPKTFRHSVEQKGVKSTSARLRNLTREDKIFVFIRDGFIDRYSGDRLIFPGVLCVLSKTLPEIFPYHLHWKASECHQAWWDLSASINRIIPVSFGGTSDDDNLVCTTGRKSSIKGNSTLEEIGWKIYPPGKLEDWDGLLAWFMNHVGENSDLLLNDDINNWYKTTKKFLEEEHGQKRSVGRSL